MRVIDTIILHHTAGSQGGFAIRRDHMENRGWSDIFYHYVIEYTGYVFNGRPLHVAVGRRRTAIHIALVGRLNVNDPTEEQVESLLILLDQLEKRFGIKHFLNHRDVARTVCPGHINIKIYYEEMLKLREDVKNLQTRLLSLEERVNSILNWREDLRAFIHRVIIPRIEELEGDFVIPNRKEGSE